jgi:hypothetical protein
MPLDAQTHYELMYHFIDASDFLRMLDLGAKVTEDFTTYEELKKWTSECLHDAEDTQFLIEFARLSFRKKLNGTDLECCSEFHIQGFYYNAQKEICLTMPR